MIWLLSVVCVGVVLWLVCVVVGVGGFFLWCVVFFVCVLFCVCVVFCVCSVLCVWCVLCV